MKLSIITSLYKSEKYLKNWSKRIGKVSHKLDSLGIDHEFILVSNDTNESENYFFSKIKSNEKVKILNVPRESIYASWNRGVKNASGDLCTFWNVDDIRFVGAIKEGIGIMSKEKIDIAYFPFIYIRQINFFNIDIPAKIKIINPPEFSKSVFIKEMHAGPFFMFRKKICQEKGYFDESFKIAGDFEWMTRMSRLNSIIRKVDMIAGIFTNNGKTLSGSKSSIHKEENYRIINNI